MRDSKAEAKTKRVGGLKRELWKVKGKLAEAEGKLKPKFGVRMKIISEEFALSGLLRRPRLRYRIQCGGGFLFTCWADSERAKCPRCGYSALVRILRREWEERGRNKEDGPEGNG